MDIRFPKQTNPFHWRLVCMQRPPRDSKPDPNKIFVAAQREILSGRVKEGIAILESALSKALQDSTFDESYHPLLIRLTLLLEASGNLRSGRLEAERKDQLIDLLLQAQIVAGEYENTPLEEIPPAIRFRLNRVPLPGSPQTGPVSLAEFKEIAGRLAEQADTATVIEKKTEPSPRSVTPPQPTISPRPAAPPSFAPVPVSAPVPRPTTPAEPSRPTLPPPPPRAHPGPELTPRLKEERPLVPPQSAPVVKRESEPIPAAKAPQPAAQPPLPPPPPPPPPPSKPEPVPEPELPPEPPKPLTEAQQRALNTVKFGQGQLGNKNYKAAIPLYLKALETDPSCAQAQEGLNACARGLLDLAEREFGRRQTKGAGTLLSQAESARPNDPGTLARMARLDSQLKALEPKPIHPAPPARATAAPEARKPIEPEAPASPPPPQEKPVAPPKPVLSPAQRQAAKLLRTGTALKIGNPSKALDLFLEAKGLDPENSEITAELESLFTLYGERAQRLETSDPRAAQFACSQALRIKPGNSFIVDIAERVAARLAPDLGRRPSLVSRVVSVPQPEPMPAPPPPPPAPPASKPAPPKKEPPQPTPAEDLSTRIRNLLTIAKNNWTRGKIGHATILDVTEQGILVRDPDNPWALCYCLLVRLAQKFPFLLDLKGEEQGAGDQRSVSRFYGRLQRIIRVLEFFDTHPEIQQKEMTEKHAAVFYLVGGPSKVLNGMREAKAAADPYGDPALRQRVVQRIRAEFEAVMALEIETPEEKAAREAKKQQEREAAKQQKAAEKEALIRREVVNYFVDHPGAKVKELPGRIWTAIYKTNLFPCGIKEARRLAERAKLEPLRQEVVAFLLEHPGISTTEIMRRYHRIHEIIYKSGAFPDRIREAWAAAEEARKSAK